MAEKAYAGVEAEVDAEDFDARAWSTAALQQRKLADLNAMSASMAADRAKLDHQSHTMVYTNYSNFAAGTKLISGLKDQIAGTDDELRVLEKALEGNHEEIALLSADSKEGLAEVDRLVAITSTLNGIQLLLELPRRLRCCLEAGDLAVGVRLWLKGRGILEKHKAVPSLHTVRKQCRPYVARITAQLWLRLESPDLQLEDLSENVDSLRKLGLTKEGLNAELKARLMGKVLAKLDAQPPRKKRKGPDVMVEAAHDLVRSMKAALMPEGEVRKSVLRVIAPRLASFAAEECEAVLSSGGDDDDVVDAAMNIALELANVAVNGLDGLEAASVKGFLQDALNQHIATAVVGNAFDPVAVQGGLCVAWALRQRKADEVLVRAKVAFYVADPECADQGGLELPEGCTLKDVGNGLLRRFAELEGECVDSAVQWVMRQWRRGARPSLGQRVMDMLTKASLKLNGGFLGQAQRGALLRGLHQRALRSVLETLRGEVLPDLDMYRHFKTEVRRIGMYTISAKLSDDAAWEDAAWEDEMALVLKARCAVPDDGINEFEGDVEIEPNEADLIDPTEGREPASPTNLSPRRGNASWEKGRLVGRCSFGEVYAARRADGTEDMMAAIKLRPLAADQLRELLDEVNALRAVQHRNLVELLGCQFLANELHVYTEHIEGKTLGSIVRATRRLAEVDAICYVAEVASGLSYLHAQGVVHSDVKGDNVLVDAKTGQVKIADFAGGVKQVQAAQASTSRGTPLWMPPEMISNNESTKAADVWSFGILTCEVLGSGKVPWPKFESTGDALKTIGNWAEPLPSNVPKDLSKAALDFLRCCLNPSKTLRWHLHALLWHPWLRPYHRAEGLRGFASPGSRLHHAAATPAELAPKYGPAETEGPMQVRRVASAHVLAAPRGAGLATYAAVVPQ
eukprot:TRINITY_DN27886_c0_g1_i1.p1 TRINITY_DN27886_c0_g1~~TRINITY_DN27886_c0_g1_i1.p1  ORF type:complete len:912 (+),score=315.43 TRINITY_DN27886_c0_g1_i1:86-2821(+)